MFIKRKPRKQLYLLRKTHGKVLFLISKSQGKLISAMEKCGIGQGKLGIICIGNSGETGKVIDNCILG